MASLLSTFSNPKCSPSFSGELAFPTNSLSLTKHSWNRNLFYSSSKAGKPRRSHRCFSVSSMFTIRKNKEPVEDDESDTEETLLFNETLEAPGEDPRPLNEIWREIQGSNDWEGLLDPMNSHLRREIIRYGELAQACYDSFDFDPHSKYCGTCKYPGEEFFDQLETGYSGYTMARYLYATSSINLPNFFQHSRLSKVWSKYANWMGYISVMTDEDEIKRIGRRDILIAWRGTVTYLEWLCDLKDILHPANFGDNPSVKIEAGFFDLYTQKESNCHYCSFSAREQLLVELKRILEYYKGEEISITVAGHSLGSALAIISAYDIAEMRDNIGLAARDPITVYSFAGPRVGNLKFKERCEELGVKVLRVVNVHDKVPTVPGFIANEKMQFQKYLEDKIAFPWSYAHVGVELALDHNKSPFLKSSKDLNCSHNLEAYIHLVDGYHGKGKRFKLATKRDIALVNKSCDFLKGGYGVPPNWKQDANKGMVRTRDGRWAVPERRVIDGHPPDTALLLSQVLKTKVAEILDNLP